MQSWSIISYNKSQLLTGTVFLSGKTGIFPDDKKQIKNFYSTLKLYDSSLTEKPNDWLNAFNLLIKYQTSLPQERKVILLDELPWMDTPKSGFISALEHFWNGWASSRRDIVLIVCGSATSWMMDNLINNHGGLHNRLTRQMFLEPFTLNETEHMLESLGFNLSRDGCSFFGLDCSISAKEQY